MNACFAASAADRGGTENWLSWVAKRSFADDRADGHVAPITAIGPASLELVK